MSAATQRFVQRNVQLERGGVLVSLEKAGKVDLPVPRAGCIRVVGDERRSALCVQSSAGKGDEEDGECETAAGSDHVTSGACTSQAGRESYV